jgi:hypothetical protein
MIYNENQLTIQKKTQIQAKIEAERNRLDNETLFNTGYKRNGNHSKNFEKVTKDMNTAEKKK